MYSEELPVTGLAAITIAGISISLFQVALGLLAVGVGLSLIVRYTGSKSPSLNEFNN